jgi:hypothetical protein
MMSVDMHEALVDESCSCFSTVWGLVHPTPGETRLPPRNLGCSGMPRVTEKRYRWKAVGARRTPVSRFPVFRRVRPDRRACFPG